MKTPIAIIISGIVIAISIVVSSNKISSELSSIKSWTKNIYNELWSISVKLDR